MPQNLLRPLFLCLLAASSCSKHRPSESVAPIGSPPPVVEPTLDVPEPLGPARLVFAGIDPLSTPWQSAVYEMDLESKAITTAMTGESGDPVIINVNQELLFFNRSTTSQNFRILTQTKERVSPSEQRRFSGGDVGDPHDAVSLGGRRVLLAHYVQGSLAIMDMDTGALIKNIDVSWDLPAGVKLKPEALISRDVDGETRIFIVHQALGYQDGMAVVDGSQRVFVLRVVGNDVEPVDIDPATDGVQGLLLKGSLPAALGGKSSGGENIILVSLCSRYILEASRLPESKHSCVNAVESLDPKTNIVSTVWDLSDTQYYMNGSIIAGDTDSSFFASTERDASDESIAKEVVRFDLESKEQKSVYSFAATSGGYWATFYDAKRQTLMVGEEGTGTPGKLTLIHSTGDPQVIALNHVPYSGAFLSND